MKRIMGINDKPEFKGDAVMSRPRRLKESDGQASPHRGRRYQQPTAQAVGKPVNTGCKPRKGRHFLRTNYVARVAGLITNRIVKPTARAVGYWYGRPLSGLLT